MNNLKFTFLAVLLLLPIVVHSPDRDNRTKARILYDGYYKVMPFDGIFDDRFEIYIYGLAQKVEVVNPDGLSVDYNKIQYFKFDNGYKIIDIKAEATNTN